MVAEQHGGRRDALSLGNLDHGLGAHHGPAGAPQGAVGYDVDALFLAQVDNLLLGQARVVLDLVDGGDDGGVGEKLLEVLDAVLGGVICGDLKNGESSPTLQTPTPLVLPVATSFSICFHVSTWLYGWIMSRDPSGFVGNLSWLPSGLSRTGQCYSTISHPDKPTPTREEEVKHTTRNKST